jgi:hypothetical protein
MDTGWIAAVGTLPDEVRAVLAQEPPATLAEVDQSEEWSIIFRTWSQFAQTADPMPPGNLNAFIAWATPNWRIDQNGAVGGQPSVGDVRAAYESFFSGTTTMNHDLDEALTRITESTEADDEDGSPLAQALATGAESAYATRFAKFRADIAAFGARAARADAFAENVSAAIRAENQRVIDNIEDRTYTDLKVLNWGGTVLVIIGDNHNLASLGAPAYDYDGYIAKRSATVGVGEWVVSPDPAEWLEWIQYETGQLGSKKPVVVGNAQKYDIWDG